MNRSLLVAGVLLILVAVLAGGAVSAGMYQWEQASRPTPQPTFAPATPIPATATPAAGMPVATGTAPTTGVPVATGTAPAAEGDAAVGQKVFGQLCDACHPGGQKGLGPALSGSDFEVKYGDDAALANLIRTGTSQGMPGFPATRVSDTQLKDIVAFLRSLSGAAGGAAGAKATPSEVPVLGQLTWTGSYARDVQPIFDEYCEHCHGATLAENGLRLDTYAGVLQGTVGGAVVIPGSASGSTLVWVIQGLTAPQIRMPHGDHPLSPNRIQNIVLWIDAGAPDD